MKKTMIAITAITAIIAAGTTTTFALSLGNDDNISVKGTTSIPEIKNIENPATMNASKTDAEETYENAEAVVNANTATEAAAQTKSAAQTVKNEVPDEVICEYCGGAYAHHYEDADGDGICDHYSEYHNEAYGSHHRNFTDTNGDGICDNYGTGGYGQGRGHHGRHY